MLKIPSNTLTQTALDLIRIAIFLRNSEFPMITLRYVWKSTPLAEHHRDARFTKKKAAGMRVGWDIQEFEIPMTIHYAQSC